MGRNDLPRCPGKASGRQKEHMSCASVVSSRAEGIQGVYRISGICQEVNGKSLGELGLANVAQLGFTSSPRKVETRTLHKP